ncbi:protein CREG1-like, partial [Sceloporus undulatus]|uniref:protein CREG1-like n=1 Tax=Sceloporus undulatus TaxID=8520 RepID=UPI001C4C3B6E
MRALVALWAAVVAVLGTEGIPPHEEAARVARFVAHACDWGALATLSAQEPPMRGRPFANVFSLSDGPAESPGSGVPYLYLTALEVSVKDLQVRDTHQAMRMMALLLP